MEGGGRSLIDVLYQYFPGGTWENYKKPSQSSRCRGDSTRAPAEYKSTALSPDQPILMCTNSASKLHILGLGED
jgi:hypothetical protein